MCLHTDATSQEIHCFLGLLSFVTSQDLSTGVSCCCWWEDSDFPLKICSSKENTQYSHCLLLLHTYYCYENSIKLLFNNNILNLFYRYGIRIDPFQWLIVLNGGTAEFSIENPSVFLFICQSSFRSSLN
jgi:hypothetical protein